MGYICYSCVHRSDCADADFQTGICEHYKHKPAENASKVRLIDAEKLLKRVDEEREYLKARGQLGAEHILVHNFRDLIDNAPTVEAKTTGDCIIAYGDGYETARRLYERPQGEWLMESKLYGGFGDSVLAITCSICKESFVYHGKTHNFCPECGAAMKYQEV